MDWNTIYNEVFEAINPIFAWIENFINTVVGGGFDVLLKGILGYDQWKWLIDIFSGVA